MKSGDREQKAKSKMTKKVETKKDVKKAKGGTARAKALSPEERSAISQKAATARWAKDLPKATYTGDLKLGEMVCPCSVLSDGTRILTQSDFMSGMNMYYSGWVSKNRSEEALAADIPQFLALKSLKPFVDKHLGDLGSITVSYRTEQGRVARGIKADIIPKICDVWLDAEKEGKLGPRQKEIAAKALVIVRALAHVGIVALVDEVTGYQRVRAKEALADIFEAFIAKELAQWVKTFPEEFYEQLFRLRGMEYPRDTVARPLYFGRLTNDIVYDRLAPGVLDELKRTIPKTATGRPKGHLHQKLTRDVGHPKLLQHLSSVVTVMKLSSDYTDFKQKLDKIHPRYGKTLEMDFDRGDSGQGL